MEINNNMTTKNLYRGFSTQEYENHKTFVLRDVELVKRDILNHIFTKRKTRVKMAQYGTGIPDLLFEPLDEFTIDIVREDLLLVVSQDPRVTLRDILIVPIYAEKVLVASLDLNYVELNLNDVLEIKLEFEK